MPDLIKIFFLEIINPGWVGEKGRGGACLSFLETAGWSQTGTSQHSHPLHTPPNTSFVNPAGDFVKIGDIWGGFPPAGRGQGFSGVCHSERTTQTDPQPAQRGWQEEGDMFVFPPVSSLGQVWRRHSFLPPKHHINRIKWTRLGETGKQDRPSSHKPQNPTNTSIYAPPLTPLRKEGAVHIWCSTHTQNNKPARKTSFFARRKDAGYIIIIRLSITYRY